MRRRIGVGFALLVAGALLAGCTKGGMGVTSATSAGPKIDLDALAAMNEDCLQYIVSTRDDGSQVWHADYPSFYLIDAKTDKLVMETKDRPLASGITYRQARALMEAHPDLEKTSVWGVRLMRYEQIVRDGKELSRSEAVEIMDFDLGELLAKDGETRKRLEGTLQDL